MAKQGSHLFQPGKSGNPNGRPKGKLNKSNEIAKKAIAMFLEDTAHEVLPLWKEVAQEDPKEAIKLWGALAEFIIPKQSRIAHSGTDEEPPVQIVISDKI